MPKPVELRPSQLRSICDPAAFQFQSTAELTPLDTVIGQERAVQAIDFGLKMNSTDYNIFVTGIEGTGKSTIVRDIVGQHARQMPTPQDWCLVNNFQDEFRPVAIAVPSGRAAAFGKQIQRLIERLKLRLPQAFEEAAFESKKADVARRFEEREQKLFQDLDEAAAQHGLAIHKSSTGIQPVALLDGQPLSREAFEQLPEAQRRQIEENLVALHGRIEASVRDVQKNRQNLGREIEKLTAETTRLVVRDSLALVREEYKDDAGVSTYLESLENDIVENVALFLPHEDHAAEEAEAWMPPVGRPTLERYLVNVLVDRSQTQGAPVIFEPNPSFRNVFGWIERRTRMGMPSTDFSMVQAGSLLQANGGFLIMEIESVLMDSMVWAALKRALLNRRAYIEDPATYEGHAPAALRPAPIDLDVKVILIGGYEPFEMLQNHDPKFNKIFKVRADFDYEVAWSDETLQLYARFIARVCREQDLLHFTPAGVAAIVEFGKKYVSHQEKLSLRFGPIVGIIKEAEHWARTQKADMVTDQHVYRAFDEHRFRYNLYEEKIHASYVDRTLLIDVDGDMVGQVNALAVYQMGDISFGRPSRITAETFMGKNGVINIERESRLSGQTHDKGVLILSGYLGRTFAQSMPLCLAVSLTFEQNYGGVDGDSASSTELYAILSSLSGVPIHQGLAVTGSVNQKGAVQAIGGVNQKIEGFFEVCKSLGLTGRQGVLIPRSNVQNLMLKNEVIDAVAHGRFHIYPVTTIEEGIEILTGLPAGQADARGRYPEGCLYHKVQQRLESYFRQALLWRQAAQAMPLD